MNQPLKMVNSLVCRLLADSGPKKLNDPNEVLPPVFALHPVLTVQYYHLLYTESADIQLAAFRLLHGVIPAAQEEISLEAALSKKDAHVSEELLSLLIDAPTLDTLAESTWEPTMPMSLRGYLFGWMLVFDHFSGSVCLSYLSGRTALTSAVVQGPRRLHCRPEKG